MTPARPVVARAAAIGALLAVPVVWILAVYLWTIVSRRYAFPIGYDTPKYVWRTNLVGGEGLAALKGSAPEPFRVNADRPAFPVLISMVSSVLGTSVFRVAVVFPAVMALATGLAAGAFSREALAGPSWGVPVFAVAVGASVNISRMAAPGYDDNLLLAVVVVAAATLALAAAAGRRGGVGAALLLAAGILIHWIFAAFFLAVLAAVATAVLPGSIREWRRTGRPLATPSGRLAAVLGGGALVGGGALLSLAAGEPTAPRLPGESFRVKLDADLPRYALPVTVPVAAVGAAGLAGGGDDGGQRAAVRRRGAMLLVIWAAAGVLAAFVLHAGPAVPAHRLLAFGLGMPILAAAGLVAVARTLAGRAGGAGAAAGAILVAAGLAGTTTLAFRAWTPAHPWMPRAQVAQAGEAGRYLEAIGGNRPIVFLVDLGGRTPLSSTSLAFHVIRAGLPPALIPRTLVYLGDAETYARGRQTLRPTPPTFNQASGRHWPSVEAALAKDPIGVLMPSINRGFDQAVRAHPDWRVGPHVAIVGGSPTFLRTVPSGPAIPAPVGPLRGAALALVVLFLPAAVGLGWSASLGPEGWLERLALAPAFGIGTLVVGGVVAGRLGATMAGAAAAVLITVVAAAGWAPFVARGRARRPGGPPTTSAPDPR
jgi:hypothetical protein